MSYKYKLIWKGIPEEVNDNMDTEFSSEIPIEIGHHIEQVHCVIEVISILHRKFSDEWLLVVEPICTVEEYGIHTP